MKEKKPVNQKRNEDNKASGDLGFERSSGGFDAPQYGGASNPDIPIQVLDKMQDSFQADFSNVNIRTNSLKAVDYTKFLILAFVVIGTLLSTVHATFLINAFPKK